MIVKSSAQIGGLRVGCAILHETLSPKSYVSELYLMGFAITQPQFSPSRDQSLFRHSLNLVEAETEPCPRHFLGGVLVAVLETREARDTHHEESVAPLEGDYRSFDRDRHIDPEPFSHDADCGGV